jgi:hypothetical protein
MMSGLEILYRALLYRKLKGRRNRIKVSLYICYVYNIILCVVELEEKRFIERAKVAINTSLVNAKEEYQRGDVVVEEKYAEGEEGYAEGEEEGMENNGEEQKEEGVVEEDKKDEGVGTGEVDGEEGGEGEEHVEAEVQAEEEEGEGKQFVEAEMQVEGGNDEEQQQQEDADVNENVYEEDRKEIINEDENGTKVEIHEEKRVENQDGTTTTVQVTKITKTVEIQETKQIIAEGDDNVEGNDEIIEGEHQAISVDNENAHNSQQPEPEPSPEEEQQQPSSSPVAEGGSGGIIQLEEEN